VASSNSPPVFCFQRTLRPELQPYLQPLVDEIYYEICKIDTGETMKKHAQQEQPRFPLTDDPVVNHPSNSHKAGIYEIRVSGQLDEKWSDWFDGMQVKLLENGEMVLRGAILDQAALMGVLNKLGRLNLALISLRKVKTKNLRRK
jgi:hypothetical protein